MSVPFDPVTLLQSLIAYPSVSSRSNVDVTQAVAGLLERLGFGITLCDYLDAAGVPKSNLIASRLPSKVSQSTVGLAYFCHTDVVPADDWCGPGEAFDSVIANDRIYGRGSCDMKGSLVAMLAAISRIDASTQRAPIHVVCTADEEVAFVGAKHVVAHSPEYREMVAAQPVAIIGEPTLCDVVHAHKGVEVYRFISRGRAAHSSTREGLNANIAMVPMIDELLRLYHVSETDTALRDNRFDPPTLSWNFGFSDFATASNIVPSRSEAWVCIRTMPTIDGGSLIDAAAAKSTELGLEFVRSKGGGHVWIDPDCETIRDMCIVAGTKSPKTVCYGTDGGEFTELKRMVILGPGDIAQAHTADEFLSLGELHRGTNIYTAALRRWCC